MLPPGVLRFDTPPARLRAIVFLEGFSYLALLFVAMPLKYLAGMPLAVRVVGSLHGALFVALLALTLQALRTRGKSLAWGVRIGVASLLPFATFWLDPGLRADDEHHRAKSGDARSD
jgi:integral membrane protein